VSVQLTELRPEAVRLFEVVARELVDIRHPLVLRLEAIDEALVQVGAEPLRGGAVDGLLDEDVPKPEPSERGRPYEATRGERVHVHLGRRRRVGVHECNDILEPELLSDDGAALEHGPLARP
jgi:hypothetical protein